jgi:hypothetical protein
MNCWSGFLAGAARPRALLLLMVLVVTGFCFSEDDLCRLPQQVRGLTVSSDEPARKILDRIGEVIPAKTDNIALYPSTNPLVKALGGAAAKICGNQRWIFFDPYDINLIARNGGKDRSGLPRYFALAHEAAHHINGDTLGGNAWNPEQELSADYSAATWLAQIGVTRDQLLEAFDALHFPVASVNGYPTRAERRAMVIKGYELGSSKRERVTRDSFRTSGFPSVILECECGQCEHGGGGAVWVFEGLRGQAMWRYGAVADLAVEKFDGQNFTIRRVDPAGSYSSKYAPQGQLFTATYTGTTNGTHLAGDVFACKWDGVAQEQPCSSSASCPLTSDQVLELGKNAANAGLKSAARQCFRMAASMGNATAQILVDDLR